MFFVSRARGRAVLAVCGLLGALATPPALLGAPPSTPAVAANASASIPIPQIVTRAEDVRKILREVDALMAPAPAIVAIQSRLPDVGAKLDPEFRSTIEVLEQGPPVGIQERLIQSWQTSRAELAGWQDVVTRRATDLERELTRLEGLRAIWVQTRADAQSSRAPTPVLENVDTMLTDLEAARVRLQAQRAVTLVLQDQVAERLKRCQEALAQIERLRQGALAQTFTRSTPAIWSRELDRTDFEDAAARVTSELAASVALVRNFVTAHAVRLLGHALLFVGLIFAARAARASAHGAARAGADVHPAVSVFDRPYSAAAVAALVSVLWIYPGRPRTIGDVAGILLLVPLLRILQPLAAPAMASTLYVFAGLILVDRVRAQLVVTPLGDQVIMLLEMLVGMIVLGRLVGDRRLARDLATGGLTARRLRWQTAAAGFGFVVCAAAFVAAAHGTMRLARFLGSGMLVDLFLVLAGYAALKIGDGFVAVAVQTWPLRELGMVTRHRQLLERRAHQALGAIIVGTCGLAVLTHRGLLEPAAALGYTIFTAELRRGGIGISAGDVLMFAATVWLAFLVSAFVRFVLEEDVFPRLELGRGVSYTISSLLHYTVLLLGFLLAIAALGVDLNKVTILAGAFGVGLGFGLQGMVNNFVSGLIVLLERPMEVGDTIQMGDVAGSVRRIGIRSTTVQTAEGAEVIVPNASLVTEKVTNWTLSSRLRRVDVPVGVAYGTPPDKVLQLLRGVAAAHPEVLATPAPDALLLEFADSAMKFELRAWTDRFDRWLTIKSDLNVAVYGALQDAGIDIPVPRRDVVLRRA